MDERSRELLFEVLQLLRREMTLQFSDWKDADDWIFSNLSLTEDEITAIYEGRDELVYPGSAV